jgi:hypothetical protein
MNRYCDNFRSSFQICLRECRRDNLRSRNFLHLCGFVEFYNSLRDDRRDIFDTRVRGDGQ